MRARIRKFVTTNPGYKVLALILAFALWLVVYNSEDPNRTTTYTVAVTMENEDSLTEMGKCYQIMNNSGNVTFAVTAKRSVLDKLANSDFTAVADLKDVTISDDGSVGTVPIEITANKYQSNVKFSGRTKYMEISLENLVTKQYVVEAVSKGTVMEGHALGTVEVTNPNVLKLSGPESIIERIEKVVASIDVDGMSQNITDNVTPVIYDAEGSVIDTERLTFSNSTVTIKAQILDTKEVTLQFSTSGKPAGENTVLGIESNPESVIVKGTTANLNQLSAIVIPDTVLNIEGATADVPTTVNITEYLPEGVELLDSTQANISVVVHIQTYGTKNYNISTAELNVEGLGDGLTVSYSVSAVSVTVSGADTDLEALSGSQIRGTIDLTGMKAGNHYVEVKLNLDTEKYTYTTVQVQVVLTDNSGEKEET